MQWLETVILIILFEGNIETHNISLKPMCFACKPLEFHKLWNNKICSCFAFIWIYLIKIAFLQRKQGRLIHEPERWKCICFQVLHLSALTLFQGCKQRPVTGNYRSFLRYHQSFVLNFSVKFCKNIDFPTSSFVGKWSLQDVTVASVRQLYHRLTSKKPF